MKFFFINFFFIFLQIVHLIINLVFGKMKKFIKKNKKNFLKDLKKFQPLGIL